ncbi:MAG: MBL fold metallo-hydrolase [Phycisphaerales bacterium]|nr:MBL fold metallo-hydrolase [Phycisphaerales bacterium]
MMLTLTFLGVGSAFARRNLQSNALVEAWSRAPQEQPFPDDNLLIDFGGTGPTALHQLKVQAGFEYLDRAGRNNYLAIRRLFLTHLHADHVGGVEELAWSALAQRGGPGAAAAKSGGPGRACPGPELLVPDPLLPALWDHTLKGGLGAMEGRTLELSDFFTVRPLSVGRGPGQPFRLMDRYELRPIPTDHIRIQRKYDWPSYGLLLTDRHSGETAVFSGDTRFEASILAPLLSTARASFHEVQLEPGPQPVHALLDELAALPEAITRRVRLYHYGDEWDEPRFAPAAQKFAGFAAPFERYTVFA